MKYLYIF